MTGGFMFGENPEQFKQRQRVIQFIREKVSAGTATDSDINDFTKALGVGEHAEHELMFQVNLVWSGVARGRLLRTF